MLVDIVDHILLDFIGRRLQLSDYFAFTFYSCLLIFLIKFGFPLSIYILIIMLKTINILDALPKQAL